MNYNNSDIEDLLIHISSSISHISSSISDEIEHSQDDIKVLIKNISINTNNILEKIYHEIQKTNIYLSKLANVEIENKKLPTNYLDYINQNIIITDCLKQDIFNFVQELANQSMSEVVEIDDGYYDQKNSSFASKIVSLCDNDYALIDYKYIELNGFVDLLYDVIINKSFGFISGTGEMSRRIALPTKSINYIIFAESLDFIDNKIKEAIKLKI